MHKVIKDFIINQLGNQIPNESIASQLAKISSALDSDQKITDAINTIKKDIAEVHKARAIIRNACPHPALAKEYAVNPASWQGKDVCGFCKMEFPNGC